MLGHSYTQLAICLPLDDLVQWQVKVAIEAGALGTVKHISWAPYESHLAPMFECCPVVCFGQQQQQLYALATLA